MLACLRVRQFAIIDEIELEPGRGLNVITGETGAGKSILVHGLQLVLGARARPDAIRAGSTEAEVEALFTLDDLPAIRARLGDLDLTGDELLIRRVVSTSGRTRAYIDGRLATVAQLQALAAGLVDISSQHEHHSLVDPASHLSYLDAFAAHAPLVAEAREAYEVAVEADRQQRDLASHLSARSEREELLRFQLAEIEKVDPRPSEEETLRAEVERLRHAATLAATTGAAEDALYGGEHAISRILARVAADLEQAVRRDDRLAPIAAQVESARVEIVDAAQALARYSRSVVIDPERQVEAEDRLHALGRLSRRFGGTLEAVVAHRARLAAELAQLDDVDTALASAGSRASAAANAALEAAQRLSESRRAAAESLGLAISRELSSLAMGGAEVRVELAPIGGEGLSHRGVVLGPRGIDRAEFLIAPNRGEQPRPLGRVASGGELSRSLLAIKRVLAGLGPVGTYVFDEVDTGVGGAVADTIGRKLAEVGRHHQVLCITHHPQIAAWGTHHFHVQKEVQGGRTLSAIRPLAGRERIEELARMMGGATVTASTRKAASELLENAR
jgi:DNA repair protein RecN (Recombination protein N)